MGKPPGSDEFELTLLGPGYGESIALHIGDGAWVVIDSCIDRDGQPQALRYLEGMGVDPATAVTLVVATHWHDDHVRGLTQVVKTCRSAHFCCAAALCREEFLELVGALEGRHFSASGSGLREIHGVFAHLQETGQPPIHALADRAIIQRQTCRLWSLSPGDDVFQRFLRSVERMIPNLGETKTRIRSIAPNEASVAIWVDAGEFALLLGADLEKRGWKAVLQDTARPPGQASVFKVPHHGSKNADEPEVWLQMLESDCIAVLTPWRLGGRILPTMHDVRRILAATPNAYVTAKTMPTPNRPNHADRAVERTLRESGAKFRRLTAPSGSVRLRRPLAAGRQWAVATLGDARHLRDYAA